MCVRVCSCICLEAFVVSLLSVPVPGKVSFKLHLRRLQLPNLVSRPRGGCEVIVNGVIRFLRLLLTSARWPPSLNQRITPQQQHAGGGHVQRTTVQCEESGFFSTMN